MTPQQLPDTEPRCAARADRPPYARCPERETCLRHQQYEAERMDARLDAPLRRAYKLPRVGSLACHYRVAAPAVKNTRTSG